jgi:small subunit ribosomal protein S17
MPETQTQPTTVPAASEKSEAAHHERGLRKERQGKVLKSKMAKTIVVEVERRFPHPRYKKVVAAYTKLYAHDEKGEAKEGDVVLIQETRPLSKLKRWRLLKVVERAAGVAPVAA